VKVHQLVPRLEPGAVGTAVVEGRLALRAAGYESEIIADEIDDRWADLGTRNGARLDELVDPDTRLVYHLAIGSNMADRLIERRERLVVVYHNLTPGALLEPWDPNLGPAIGWGRQQLRRLARRSDLGIAMSRYSERELRDAGMTNTVTVPVLVDGHALARPDAGRVGELLEPGTSTWLYVSRLAPHKAQHDLLQSFALYRRVHDPNARLWLCGSSASDRYSSALRGFVDALDLGAAVEFTGPLPAAELAARFAAADVFVSLSDHEGFGVPFLEAWQHDLPVIAFGSSAVPETVGDAGLVLADKTPSTVAAAVARLVGDRRLSRMLIERGRQRLVDRFDPVAVRRQFIEAIESVR
jgi:glycosyltransferase involved in cell wall biosynthesis